MVDMLWVIPEAAPIVASQQASEPEPWFVWNRDDEVPGADSRELAEGCLRLGQVLEDLQADYELEAVIREGQVFDAVLGDVDRGQPSLGKANRLLVHVHGHDAGRKALAEAHQGLSLATARIEHGGDVEVGHRRRDAIVETTDQSPHDRVLGLELLVVRAFRRAQAALV
jgi:hypothetical protein